MKTGQRTSYDRQRDLLHEYLHSRKRRNVEGGAGFLKETHVLVIALRHFQAVLSFALGDKSR